MTDALVRLILTGEDSGATAALDAVGGQLDTVGGKLAGFAPGGAIAAGAVAGIAAISAAAIGVGAAALGLSEDMDAAMNTFSARTGVAGDELEQFRGVAADVFDNNWGESFQDVADVMSTVQQITGAGADSIGDMTQNAIILRDVFDKDVGESIDAAKVLMDEMGLSSQQAFDLITTGLQNGLDRNGDFLDTIREYGNLFGDAGFSAEQFYNILETGAEGGALGTDKVADAVKEFQIRFLEGGDEMVAAVEELTGDSWQMFIEEIQAGDSTVAETFTLFTQLLAEMEDPIERNALQVALFGTQAEDLGVSFTEGLGAAITSLDEMAGATQMAGDAVSQGLAASWEGFKRTIQTSLLPLGDWLGQALDAAVPYLQQLGDWLAVTIPAATETLRAFWVDVAWPAIMQVGDWIAQDVFPVFVNLYNWLDAEMPGALETLRAFWVDEAWPVIRDTLESIWGFLEPNVFTPLGEWLDEKLPVALEFLRTTWVDTVWPALQVGAEVAWEIIKAILEGIQVFFDSTLPTALESAKSTWESVWGAIQTATQTASSIIQPVFDAVKSFADWLSGFTFDFKFNIPGIPDWMIPHSPLPIHTAWKNFGDYLRTADFTPKMSAPVATTGQISPQLPTGSSNQTVYQFSPGSIVVRDETTGRALLNWLQNIEDRQVTGAF